MKFNCSKAAGRYLWDYIEICKIPLRALPAQEQKRVALTRLLRKAKKAGRDEAREKMGSLLSQAWDAGNDDGLMNERA